MRRALLATLLVLTPAACSDDAAAPDPMPDAGPPDPCAPPELAPADEPPTRLDLAAPLPCDRARAGKVGAAQAAALPAGPQARSRPGDYKLYNCKVAFAVEGERVSDGDVSSGGLPADAELAALPADLTPGESRRSQGIDALRELSPELGTAIVQPIRVTLVADGTDGGPAVVRAEGPVVVFPLIAWILPILEAPPLWLTIDYRLSPGAEHLELLVTARNVGAGTERIAPGVALQVPRQLRPYLPGTGLLLDGLMDGGELVAWVGERISYGLFGDAPLSAGSNAKDVEQLRLITDQVEVEACGETSWLLRLAVAGDGAEGLLRIRRAALGEAAPTGRLAGHVLDGGAAAARARVHVFALPDELPVSLQDSDGDGAFSFELPPGDYRIYATAPAGPLASATQRGHAGPVDVTVAAGGPTDVELSLPPSGLLELHVVDGEGAPTPAKVHVASVSALPAPLAALGELRLAYGLAGYALTADGAAAVRLPPGVYDVTASHGFEYEIDAQQIEVTAGVTTVVDATLVRAVDATGWRSIDSHIHADPSHDGRVSLEGRLVSIAAAGLDAAVETEHDLVADYADELALQGLGGLFLGLGGDEISPAPIGHFNAFPLPVRDDEAGGGALRWWEVGFSPPTTFPALRARDPEVVIQVNHPRAEAFGYFHHCGFDPATGLPTDHEELWTTDFDAFEIVNNRQDETKMLPDYVGLLDLGVRVAPVGVSDAHEIIGAEVGCARSYLRTDAAPGALTPGEVAAAIHGQRVVASRGLFLEATIGAAGVGDLTDGATARAAGLHVRLQAPSWIAPGDVRVLENGAEIARRVLTAADAVAGTAIRFEGSFALDPARDAWIVVHARGDGDLAPVCPDAQPTAVTSPIFVDADGDGVYTPPGPPGGG